MGIRLTDAGGVKLLNYLFKGTTVPAQIWMQLFIDSSGLDDADVDGGLTIATGGGYEDISLDIADCTVAVVSNIPTATWLPLEFQFTGPLDSDATIYGYQVYEDGGAGADTVIWEEQLTTPFKPTANGDILKITPRIQIGNGTVG